MRRNFKDLSAPEVLALAISLEEEYAHRRLRIEMFRKKFGEEIPLVRRRVALMELEASRHYDNAAEQATDAEMRQLLGDLAAEERKHEETSAPASAWDSPRRSPTTAASRAVAVRSCAA